MPDVKWVATSLVSLVVAVMVIALVAVPVIEDMNENIVNYDGSNPGYSNRFADMTGTDIDYRWASGAATLNGKSVPLGVPSIVSDKIIVRTSATGFYVYDITGEDMRIVVGQTLQVTISASGDWSITIGATEWASGTGITKVLAISSTGTIGQYATAPIKAAEGQKIYLANWAASGGDGPIRFIEVTDGTAGSNWWTPFTFTNYVPGDGTADLIEGASVTYTISYALNAEQEVGTYSGVTSTWGDSSSSNNIEYFAPINYDGATVVEEGGINTTLMGIIPLMLFIVAIMVAVRIMKGA